MEKNMALQKSIELPSGITANYWKIISLSFNYIAEQTQIRVAGYSSKQAREDGKTFVIAKLINVTGQNYEEDFVDFVTDPRVNGYNYLKNTSEFENSVDV